ncbi:carboxypeptidase Y [Microthyrium microscopicum]|uniref:Carboxypeptidase Y n=1 Tax=Microthyrium microscopicum TaxID=703497 RepID=A0A6A6TZG4_9PEZI|nr:carboxypeptidase Y [Microthyrium microscopicum]
MLLPPCLVLAVSTLPFVVSAIPALRTSQWPIQIPEEDIRLSQSNRVMEQNDTICDAGSKQWSGTVNLGKGRDMFFWYFESLSHPKDDPLIIWLNGGPGASSMLGSFYEIGACLVDKTQNSTYRNPNSWTNLANIVFIDQPIGTGFSYTEDRKLWAQTLQDATLDFDKFLDGFFALFPQLDNGKRDVHFVGESFGGQYAPHYAAATRRDFASIILINPWIDPVYHVLARWEHICASGKDYMHFNQTLCVHMEEGYSTCETHGNECQLTQNPSICLEAFNVCLSGIQKWVEMGMEHRDWYDDRNKCLKPEDCDSGFSPVRRYLDSDSVKKALGLKSSFKYDPMNEAFNEKWTNGVDATVPSTRQIATLLDAKDTKVLILNGNNDISVPTASLVRTLDNLPWSKHAAYLTKKLSPWYYKDSSGSQQLGGELKQVGNLALVTVNNAGHMNVHDQPIATLSILQKWLKSRKLSVE